MTYQFTWLFFVIAIASILMNSLLIFLANRASQKPCEIKLSVILAKIDLILPTLTIIAISINIISGKDISIIPGACQIKGPVEYTVMYSSMLLVAIISFSRVSLKSQLKVTRVLKISLIFYSMIYCTLVIAAGFHKKYILLPNKIDCTPLLFADGLSTSIILLFGLSLIVCLLVTLGCYISRKFRILMGDYKDSVIPLPDRALNSFIINSASVPEFNKKFVTIKTAVICGTYFILIVPACVLLLLEGTINNQYSPLISSMIDICLNSITLVNPCLLLFTHSFFARQLNEIL